MRVRSGRNENPQESAEDYCTTKPFTAIASKKARCGGSGIAGDNDKRRQQL